jgi:retron-type reverse transcriptase
LLIAIFMPKIIFQHTYNHIISIENLLEAWKGFVCGKRARKDVQEFECNLMTNIIRLHRELAAKTYAHSKYQAFKISDPKPRDIHKASVRDRLLHHALHRTLSPFFEKTFISDSNSCQTGKGTHRALKRFRKFTNIVSRNSTCTAWVLKCDIKKFFANIDHAVLLAIIDRYIPDKDILQLLSIIVSSFNSGTVGVGLPLGNLTSQLLVNIYMNEFDQFVKHRLKSKYYIRYADDFAVVSHDHAYLERILPLMQEFLRDKLKLSMHPNKISIKTVASGVDFLGWVNFLNHRVLRTTTKRRMMKGIRSKQGKKETVQSYLGLLKHGNGWKLEQYVKGMIERFSTNQNPFCML